jgi:hypothetical protein
MEILLQEEFHSFTSSPSIARIVESRRMRWAGQVISHGGLEKCLVGKSERKGPLRRYRRRLADDIELDINEIKCEACGLDSSR